MPAKPTPTRARRRKRDAERTRDSILQAAVAEFSSKGYAGARVEAICRAARANPRMLYHHFGDKDRLYVAVLEKVLWDLRREELKLAVDHLDPAEGVMQLFEFMHAHFGEHPELIHLLSGENLLRARFLRRSANTPMVASPVLELLERLLRAGERHGSIRRGVEPLHLYVMMVALCYFHRSNAHTLSTIFQTDLLARAWQGEHRRTAAEMLARYLRPG
jgi:AcrR family transcriptional regulator